MSGVYIMACAPEYPSSPELLALQKHSRFLCSGITSISTVTHFAQSLLENTFITPGASNSIQSTMGFSDQEKCDRLLNAVKEQVRINPAMFDSFVDILKEEGALKVYADHLIKSRGENYVYVHTVCWYIWVRMYFRNLPSSCLLSEGYSISYSLELMCVWSSIRTLWGTWSVVKRLIQHKAQPSAVWVLRTQPKFQ